MSQLVVLRTVRELREWTRARRREGATVGAVPTMGALHRGHLELMTRARRENDFVVATIFVNPTQFNDAKDLENYPRPEESDCDRLASVGVHALFMPSVAEMYPNGYHYRVYETEMSTGLCGAHRPGHFEGMLTVVLKLLNLLAADRAYFGEKDFQQLTLIRGMATSFFLATEIIGCPTVREYDGLAMSSRNVRLGADERKIAEAFPRLLRTSRSVEGAAHCLREAGFDVEYVEERWGRRIAAVRIGQTRLIDNFPMEAADVRLSG